MPTTTQKNFPIGKLIITDELSRDPYPIYARLQEQEPVTWIEDFNMYLVVRYRDVERILKDDINFITGTESSTVYDTFGEHMMTVEGEKHHFYKNKHRRAFMPGFIRDNLEQVITRHVNYLIDGFINKGSVELRRNFANRLPVMTMLSLFDFPLDDEKHLRRWYDAFEAALANFTWDPTIRNKARENLIEFHQHLQEAMDSIRGTARESLLGSLVNSTDAKPLADEEIKRNASLILFGGISTVEALILNAIYALSVHPDVFQRVRADHKLIPQVVEETVRWMSPVQSATRHVTARVEIAGVSFSEGDTVNCMLAAANRDGSVFMEPDRYIIGRDNINKHLGFAIGPHRCLGAHLARTEARIALEQLFLRLPECRMDPDAPTHPEGYEFRQPASLNLVWET